MTTTTRKAITISRLDESNTLALHMQYEGQSNPQACYIELNLEDGTMSADYNSEIGNNAVPMSVYHGTTRRYTIPCIHASTANDLMESLEADAQILVNGSVVDDDDSDLVVEISAEAQAAEERIESACRKLLSDVYVVDAYDWLEEASDADIKQRLGKGESIEAIYNLYQGNGAERHEPFIDRLEKYIEELAQDLKEESEENEEENDD